MNDVQLTGQEAIHRRPPAPKVCDVVYRSAAGVLIVLPSQTFTILLCETKFLGGFVLNFKMWLLYTELSITAGQQAISSIPILAYRKHCILVQQRLDVLVTFTNSVLHCSVPSEFMSQASKLVRLRHLEGSNQGTNFAD